MFDQWEFLFILWVSVLLAIIAIFAAGIYIDLEDLKKSHDELLKKLSGGSKDE